MSSLPQSNAVLDRVYAPGLSQDDSTPAVAGALKWAGFARIYVRESVVISTANGRLDEFKRMRLILPGSLVPVLNLATGDTLVFTYQGVECQRVVKDTETAVLAGVGHQIRVEVTDQ